MFLEKQHLSSPHPTWGLGKGLLCWDQSQLHNTPHLKQMGEDWPSLSPSPRSSLCWERKQPFSLLLALAATSGEWPGHSQSHNQSLGGAGEGMEKGRLGWGQ